MPLSTPVRNFFYPSTSLSTLSMLTKVFIVKKYCLDGANKSVISTIIFLQCDMRWFIKNKHIKDEWCKYPITLCSALFR